MTMQALQRPFHHTTRIPALRINRALRRGFYNSGKVPRVSKGAISWKGIRRESTETGEDRSGHIAAGPNEGILFFDSEPLPF